jgi:hypothetical protein
MRGAHHGFDLRASCLISPPNSGSGAGSCLPLMVAAALGEPGVPVTSWAWAKDAAMAATARVPLNKMRVGIFILRISLVCMSLIFVLLAGRFERWCRWMADPGQW